MGRACSQNGGCLAVGTVAGKGSFHDGEGQGQSRGVGEDLAEVGWSVCGS